MDPDRKGAPLKTKCHSNDLFAMHHIKEIADKIGNMQSEIVNQKEFKDWEDYLDPLFIHVEDVVAFKLMVITNNSLSTGIMLAKYSTKDDEPYQEIKFLKIENWEEYINNNILCNAYDAPILFTTIEFHTEYTLGIAKKNNTVMEETNLRASNQEEQNLPEKEKEIPTITSSSSLIQNVETVTKALHQIANKTYKVIPKNLMISLMMRMKITSVIVKMKMKVKYLVQKMILPIKKLMNLLVLFLIQMVQVMTILKMMK